MCKADQKKDVETLAKTFAHDVVLARRLEASGRVLELGLKMAQIMICIGLSPIGEVKFQDADGALDMIHILCGEAKKAYVAFDMLKGADVDDDLYRRSAGQDPITYRRHRVRLLTKQSVPRLVNGPPCDFPQDGPFIEHGRHAK